MNKKIRKKSKTVVKNENRNENLNQNLNKNSNQNPNKITNENTNENTDKKYALMSNIKIMGILNLLMDFKLYGAFAIIYYTQITGSMMLGMSIFSITMIASAILEFPTGLIADKIGRKNTVILGCINSLIYAIILAFSNSYMGLICVAIFEGLERAFFSGNNQAFIYDTLKEVGKESEYREYIGKTNSMYYVAGILSTICGIIVAYFTSIKVIMIVSIIPRIFEVMLSFKLKDVKRYSPDEENVFKQARKVVKLVRENKILKRQIIADGISDGIGEATFQFRSKFYEMVWPMWAVGIPGILANIGAFTGSWFSGKILKKWGNKKVIIFSNFFSIVSNGVSLFLNNVWSPIIMVTNSVFPADVAKSDISQRLYKDEYRSSMGSLKSLVGSALYSVFAILVGWVADVWGIIFALAVAQVLKFVVIWIYWRMFRKWGRFSFSYL